MGCHVCSKKEITLVKSPQETRTEVFFQFNPEQEILKNNKMVSTVSKPGSKVGIKSSTPTKMKLRRDSSVETINWNFCLDLPKETEEGVEVHYSLSHLVFEQVLPIKMLARTKMIVKYEFEGNCEKPVLLFRTLGADYIEVREEQELQFRQTGQLAVEIDRDTVKVGSSGLVKLVFVSTKFFDFYRLLRLNGYDSNTFSDSEMQVIYRINAFKDHPKTFLDLFYSDCRYDQPEVLAAKKDFLNFSSLPSLKMRLEINKIILLTAKILLREGSDEEIEREMKSRVSYYRRMERFVFEYPGKCDSTHSGLRELFKVKEWLTLMKNTVYTEFGCQEVKISNENKALLFLFFSEIEFKP